MPFGQDYQKEVNDVNAGNIQPKAAAPITHSQDMSSQTTTRLDTRSKNEALIGLTKLASQALHGIKKTQDAKAYEEAYTTGSQEKLDELNNAGVVSKLFGNKATLRGFQERVVDDKVEQDYQRRLSTMDADVRQFSTLEDYKTSVGDPLLKDALESQTDNDVKTGITKGFTKNSRLLAGQFAKKRRLYDQILNRKAVMNGLASASKTMDMAKGSQDRSVVLEAAGRLKKALTMPNDVDPEAWEGMVKTSIISSLGNNDLNLLNAAQENGTLKDFSVETLDDIKQAKSIWNQEYSQDFYNRGIELENTLKDNPEQFLTQLATYKQTYPSLDTKRWLKAFNKAEIKRDETARELQNNTIAVSQGMGKNLSKAERSQAFANLTNRFAREAALQARKDAIRDNPNTALDINEAYSPEELNSAIKANPSKLISAWVTNQVDEVPLLRSSVSNIVTLSNLDELTETQGIELKEDLQFARHFIKKGRDLFSKQLPKAQLARVLHMDTLMNKLGYDHRKAVIEIRAGKNRDPVDTDDIDFRDYSDDALREFTDNSGFENFIGWSSDPDNQDALAVAAEREFGELLKITNDPNIAKELTTDFLAHNSIRFGDNLLLGGKELNKNSVNGDFAGYADLVENTDSWKAIWEAAGFPRNRSIKDEANVITTHPNGKGITIRSENVNGSTIYMDLLAPLGDKDMRALQDQQLAPDGSLLGDLWVVDLMSSSLPATGNTLNDIFTTPDTPASHLPPEAPEAQTTPQAVPSSEFKSVKDAIANVETRHGAASDKAYSQGKNSSGYEGKYQFRYRDKNDAGYDIATKLDIDPKAPKTPKQQEAIMDEFLKRNANRLTKKGIEPTPYNLWLAHNQGVSGAAAILRGKLTKTIRRNIRNQGVSGTTDDELIKNYHKKFKGKF